MDNKKVAEQLMKIAKEIRAKKDFSELVASLSLKFNDMYEDLGKLVTTLRKYEVPQGVLSELGDLRNASVKLVQILKKLK